MRKRLNVSNQAGRSGTTLVELMVVLALFSIITFVILQLYNSASAEFEKASGEMTLTRRARSLADKLIPILSTATPMRKGFTESFYHPDAAKDVLADGSPAEIYAVDFFSTTCFMSDTSPAGAVPSSKVGGMVAIPLTNGDTGNYSSGQQWFDGAFQKGIWEIANGLKSEPVRRTTSSYRYRLAWTPVIDGSIRARSVYLERLDNHLDNGTVDNGSSSIFRSGTSYPLTRCHRQIIEKDISRLTFQRQSGASSVIQIRTRVVNVENVGGQRVTLDGELMRDHRRSVKQRSYEIVSTVMVPNYTLGRN